jgi:hypothetical protein
MAAIYSNGGNRWNILGFNFTKRDALSSLYKISMVTMFMCHFQTYFNSRNKNLESTCYYMARIISLLKWKTLILNMPWSSIVYHEN